MIKKKRVYDEYWTNKTADVYVIYDMDTCEILEMFLTQRECISKYQSHYDGFVNIAWCKIDIIDYLRKDRLNY